MEDLCEVDDVFSVPNTSSEVTDLTESAEVVAETEDIDVDTPRTIISLFFLEAVSEIGLVGLMISGVENVSGDNSRNGRY